MDLGSLGKILLFFAIILAALGIIFILGDKIPYLGKLPGDFRWQGKHGSFYFPLTTCLLLSLLISLILNLFRR